MIVSAPLHGAFLFGQQLYYKDNMGSNFDYFKDKKITVMGLGLLGRGVNDAKFLNKCGAKLIVTDLKNKNELKSSIAKLKNCKNIKYVLGRHRLKDFENADFILKNAGIPTNSPYIKHARKNNIPIEMDESLFAKLSKATIVGITGTRGKTTVATLISKLLKNLEGKFSPFLGFMVRKVYLAGNIKGVATLPLLAEIEPNDLIVLELSSWQLQGFGESKISPRIAIFTNFMNDHLNYYGGSVAKYWNDKSFIFKYQKRGDLLVTTNQIFKNIRKKSGKLPASKIFLAKKSDIPKKWTIKLVGEHNLANIALAAKTANILGVNQMDIQRGVEKFRGVSGRLEFLFKRGGATYYNDTTSTIPEATIAALLALKKHKGKIILICGGSDKGLDYSILAKKIKEITKAVLVFKGGASDKLLNCLRLEKMKEERIFKNIESMKEATRKAKNLAQQGDIVLLSPGAASFGIFKNEFDRGDQFTAAL